MPAPGIVTGVNQEKLSGAKSVLMYVSTDVTAGNFAAIRTGQSSPAGVAPHFFARESDSANQDGKGCICGVFKETRTGSTDPGWVEVQVGGRYADANVHADTVAGDRLVASSTAGRAAPASTQLNGSATADFDYTVVGIAEEADTANAADVWLLDPMGLAS